MRHIIAITVMVVICTLVQNGEGVTPTYNLFMPGSSLSSSKSCKDFELSDYFVGEKPFASTIYWIGSNVPTAAAVRKCIGAKDGNLIWPPTPEVLECFDVSSSNILDVDHKFGKKQCPQVSGGRCTPDASFYCEKDLPCIEGACQLSVNRPTGIGFYLKSGSLSYDPKSYENGLAGGQIRNFLGSFRMNMCQSQIIVGGWIGPGYGRRELVLLAVGNCERSRNNSISDFIRRWWENTMHDPSQSNHLSETKPSEWLNASDFDDCKIENAPDGSPQWACAADKDDCKSVLCGEGHTCSSHGQCGSGACRTDPTNSTKKVCTIKHVQGKNVWTIDSTIPFNSYNCGLQTMTDLEINGVLVAKKVTVLPNSAPVSEEKRLGCYEDQLLAGTLFQVEYELTKCFTEGIEPEVVLGGSPMCPQVAGGTCTAKTICTAMHTCLDGVCAKVTFTRAIVVTVKASHVQFDGLEAESSSYHPLNKAIEEAGKAVEECQAVQASSRIAQWISHNDLTELTLVLPVTDQCNAKIVDWQNELKNGLELHSDSTNVITFIKLQNSEIGKYDDCLNKEEMRWTCSGEPTAPDGCKSVLCDVNQTCQKNDQCGTGNCQDGKCQQRIGNNDGNGNGGNGNGNGGNGSGGGSTNTLSLFSFVTILVTLIGVAFC